MSSVSKNNIIKDKKVYKQIVGKCRICGVDIYNTLSVHRIRPGCKGGKYSIENSVVVCENCHRQIPDIIQIDKYYQCSNGQLLLRIIIDGEEKFV